MIYVIGETLQYFSKEDIAKIYDEEIYRVLAIFINYLKDKSKCDYSGTPLWHSWWGPLWRLWHKQGIQLGACDCASAHLHMSRRFWAHNLPHVQYIKTHNGWIDQQPISVKKLEVINVKLFCWWSTHYNLNLPPMT